MDKDLKEVAEHLQEHGSDILSIKLLVDRTKLNCYKESNQAAASQSNFYILILILWTMILLYYFYNKDKDTKVNYENQVAQIDSTCKFKIDSLKNFVDTTLTFIPNDSIKKKNNNP